MLPPFAVSVHRTLDGARRAAAAGDVSPLPRVIVSLSGTLSPLRGLLLPSRLSAIAAVVAVAGREGRGTCTGRAQSGRVI